MKTKDTDKVKIENRGKVDKELLSLTETFIKFLCFDLDKGDFKKISPKLFYVLDKEFLEENEKFGLEFTILSDIFKGRIEIRKIKDKDAYNILFYKRVPSKGRFSYILSKTIPNVPIEDLNKQFYFIVEFEEKSFRKDDIILLKSGYTAIIKKYYSNDKIGIIYDEYSEDIEEYIKKEDIDKLIKSSK